MKRISDEGLLVELESLAQRECDATLHVLQHLNELEARRLHLAMGYASTFDFATRHLRYSASAAGRRIQAARCLRRFPVLVEFFRAREVNLSTVSMISRVINDENDEAILRRVRGKSQREVEAIAAEYQAPVRVREMVKPVRARVSLAEKPQQLARPRPHSLFDANRACSEGNTPAMETREGVPARSSEQRFKIQFSASRELMEKLEEARALLSGRFPRGATVEAVFDAALDAFLDRKSPARRHGRRQEGRTRRGRQTAPGTRHIPAAVRDAVFVRDGGRCSFVSSAGNRCGTRHDLEIDHIVPFARGGPATVENLRLLCAQHNRLEAERVYGSAWMERFGRGS